MSVLNNKENTLYRVDDYATAGQTNLFAKALTDNLALQAEVRGLKLDLSAAQCTIKELHSRISLEQAKSNDIYQQQLAESLHEMQQMENAYDAKIAKLKQEYDEKITEINNEFKCKKSLYEKLINQEQEKIINEISASTEQNKKNEDFYKAKLAEIGVLYTSDLNLFKENSLKLLEIQNDMREKELLILSIREKNFISEQKLKAKILEIQEQNRSLQEIIATQKDQHSKKITDYLNLQKKSEYDIIVAYALIESLQSDNIKLRTSISTLQQELAEIAKNLSDFHEFKDHAKKIETPISARISESPDYYSESPEIRTKSPESQPNTLLSSIERLTNIVKKTQVVPVAEQLTANIIDHCINEEIFSNLQTQILNYRKQITQLNAYLCDINSQKTSNINNVVVTELKIQIQKSFENNNPEFETSTQIQNHAHLLNANNELNKNNYNLNIKFNNSKVKNNRIINNLIIKNSYTERKLSAIYSILAGIVISGALIAMMFIGTAPLACLLSSIAILGHALNAVMWGLGIAAAGTISSYFTLFKPKEPKLCQLENNCVAERK